MTARLAVLGSPIAHSRSPLIHRAAYAALGIDWRYDAIRCGEAGLAGFLRSRGSEWRGLSLTMPLKEEAHRLAASLDPVAGESGVVNTLRRRADGGWDGFNTDVAGLAAAIRGAGLDARRTVVLGSGATAVSAVLAARSLGAEHVAVRARNAAAVAELVDRFGVTAFADEGTEPRPTLVVSTLPGTAGAALELPTGFTAIPLFDVAYDPWPSPLAERWRAAGGSATPGIAMLVEQAIVQIRIFLGGDPGEPFPDEERVRGAVARATASAGVGG
ncbi:shikimate dehydrogenase family protein [Leucobacter luti]|uniref:shikimate dehydrogenase family protein n=1 Tax=Leucobacter luti TaxID=340320 RepID=UPI003CFD4516